MTNKQQHQQQHQQQQQIKTTKPTSITDTENKLIDSSLKIWDNILQLVPIEFISNYFAMITFTKTIDALSPHLHDRVFKKLNESLDKERKRIISIHKTCHSGAKAKSTAKSTAKGKCKNNQTNKK